MRKKIAAANWKMNTTFQEAENLLRTITQNSPLLDANIQVVFAVPFPYLQMASSMVAETPHYNIAAQNCYHQKSGAYTGEVSAAMLHSIGVHYCIVGHSERRVPFGESNEQLAAKINLLFEYGIVPIFCCGEPLLIREAGTENSFVENQLKESLFHLPATQLAQLIIAYEPIWAIGTGKTATTDQAQAMHAFIRTVLGKKYGTAVAEETSLIYGGSVKASNANELFDAADVDGALVGGASLQAEEFKAIIAALK
jgi:triosephosphate isomerase (TIM)